ncbi:MAG: hypothetical protein AAF399_15005 [Bacteroidota bacterium]
MKQVISLIIAGLLGAGTVFAQPSKVTSGVLDQQSGRYVEAIVKLEKAIADESMFQKGKAKHIPKAQYALYESYYQVGIDTSGMQEQLAAAELDHPVDHPLLLAADNLTKAINHPMGKRQKTSAVLGNVESTLWGAVFNKAIEYFNSEAEGSDQIAQNYFEVADQLNPENILTNRMLGAVQLINAPRGEDPKADSIAAISTMEKTIQYYKDRYINSDDAATFKSNVPQFEQDSSQLSYLYQQIAVIYNSWGEPEKALELLEDGLTITDAEDIKRQELNIYQQNPQLLDRAKTKFESAIAASPDDVQIKLAYASMLERNEQADDAYELYKEVYETDPTQIGGIYGVGAYYINKAAAISDAKMAINDDDEIEAMDKEIIGLLEKAYPYMQKLHELQPTQREWLSQLINIAPILGKDDEMEAYYEKMKKL